MGAGSPYLKLWPMFSDETATDRIARLKQELQEAEGVAKAEAEAKKTVGERAAEKFVLWDGTTLEFYSYPDTARISIFNSTGSQPHMIVPTVKKAIAKVIDDAVATAKSEERERCVKAIGGCRGAGWVNGESREMPLILTEDVKRAIRSLK